MKTDPTTRAVYYLFEVPTDTMHSVYVVACDNRDAIRLLCERFCDEPQIIENTGEGSLADALGLDLCAEEYIRMLPSDYLLELPESALPHGLVSVHYAALTGDDCWTTTTAPVHSWLDVLAPGDVLDCRP